MRDRLHLGAAFDLTFFDRLALRTVAGFIEKKPDRNSPPCQASVRMGLPYDFLYKDKKAQAADLKTAGLGLDIAADAA